jgi:hypothetical protein
MTLAMGVYVGSGSATAGPGEPEVTEVVLGPWQASRVFAFASLTGVDDSVAARTFVMRYTVEGNPDPISTVPLGTSFLPHFTADDVTSVTFGVTVESAEFGEAQAVFVVLTEADQVIVQAAHGGGPGPM